MITLVKGLNMPLIIGCSVAGGVIVLAGLTLLGIWLYKNRSKFVKVKESSEGMTIGEENEHLDEL